MKKSLFIYLILIPFLKGFSQNHSSPFNIADYNSSVVMIENSISGFFFGAGIIVKSDKDSTVIVTAAHNIAVPNQALQTGGNIGVKFFHRKNKMYPINVLYKNPELDLAILTVRENINLSLSEQILTVLLPTGMTVDENHHCKFIGYMKQMEWNFNPDMALISTINKSTFRFSSQYVSPGASGGPLISEHGALVGMITKDNLLGSEAVSIEKILLILKELKINSHLKINEEVPASMALKSLSEKGLLNEYGLVEAITQKDESILSDFGLASKYIDSRLLTRALQTETQWEKGQSLLSNYFKESTPSSNYQWLTQIIQSGVDPNLKVPHSYYEQQSLLTIALSTDNNKAMQALLENGASPHGYQYLRGTRFWKPIFLNPLYYVLDIENDQDRDLLIQQFLDAGAVVPRVGTKGTYKYTLGAVIDLYEKYQKIYKKELQPTPSIHEQKEDQICITASQRDGFDWCQFSRNLFPMVSLYNGTGKDPLYGADLCRLEYLMHISDNKAYFLAGFDLIGNNQFESYALVEIPRDQTEWYVYTYGRGYRCKSDEKADKVNYCWTKHVAWPAAIGIAEPEKKYNSSSKNSNPSTELITKYEIDGVGLNTPIKTLDKILLPQGYTYNSGSPTVEHYINSVKNQGLKYSTTIKLYKKEGKYTGRGLDIVLYNSEIVYIFQRATFNRSKDGEDKPDLTNITKQLNEFDKKKDGFSKFEHNKYDKGLSLTASGKAATHTYFFNISLVGHNLRQHIYKRKIAEPGMEAAFFEGIFNIHSGNLYR